ncbi:B-cell receptor CD22 [Merluccius polli]|uniref:B-cell receptor CD22 n=1 Tax=Merluccius polli TaxID=89951 RepID=A0AA47NSA5_MERPO|nr:B-cell receptor CD22 [Merluccius polli]
MRCVLFFTALQGNDDWTVTYTSSNVCALRGSTVDITCTYKYLYKMSSSTLVETLWFTKGDHKQPVDLLSDADYAGRVEYRCGENSCSWFICKGKCTLRIRDLRQTDSAEYKFRFTTNRPGGKYTGDPGVTLSVTDLQVKVSFPQPTYPTWVQLECHSICDLAGPHTWYKNGQSVSRGPARSYRGYFTSEDSFSCTVEGRKRFHSPLVCVRGDRCNRVSYPTRNMCVLRGTSVDISCTYSSYEALSHKYWFKWRDNQQPRDLQTEYGGRVKYPAEETGRSTLRITDLRDTDSDSEYRFTFKSTSHEWNGTFHGTTLTVTGLSVEVTPVATVTEGQRVTLTCMTSCPLTDKPSYMWYQNNGRVTKPENPENQLVLDPVSPQHAGNYACSVRNDPHLRSPEEMLTVQCTMNAPKTPSVTVSPSGEVVEGSSVTLSCSSDANPAANYTWFKEHEDSVGESGQNYTITNITAQLGGNYYCQAHNAIGRHNSTFLFINVPGNCLFKRRTPSSTQFNTGLSMLSPISVPVYDNVLFLTNRTAPAAQREPIEEQDDLHYSSIHISHSKNQEVPRGLAGCRVQSDQTDEVLYSLVNGNNDWTVTYTSSNVCALRGSTVDITCTYKHPYKMPSSTLVETLWFTKGDHKQPVDLLSDTDYAGRVDYRCGENSCSWSTCKVKCTLRIRDLRQTDSAEYKFMFTTNRPGGKYTGDPGVTLSVTDLQVKVSFPQPTYPTWVQLECHSICDLAGPHAWYKNGQSVRGVSTRSYRGYFTSEDSFSCAVEGRERFHSPLVCKSTPQYTDARWTGPFSTICITLMWAPHITAARTTAITVISVSGVQGDRCNRVSYPTRNMCVLRGTSVDISCTYSSYEALSHKYWFKLRGNQQPRDLQTEYGGRVEYPAEETGRSTLRITDLRDTDSAEYRFTFKSTSHEWKGTFHGTTLTVTGLSVEVTPVATVTEGQRVTLTCITSCPLTDKPSYMWYQNNGPVTGPESPENQLVLDPVSPRHAGNYACSIRNDPHLRSPEETLTVQCTMNPPKTPSVTVSPSGVVEGSSVTLSCSSDANPAANYTWFKEHEDSVGESGQNYTITNFTAQRGGNYYRQAHNAIGLHNSTFLFINVTVGYHCLKTDLCFPETLSQTVIQVAVRAVLLTIIPLLIILWMRRKMASRKASGLGGRPEATEEPLSVPVYENVLFLTNRTAPAAQREPIEDQDDLHYGSIHISHSKNQEVPHGFAGCRVQSDQTDEVLYSALQGNDDWTVTYTSSNVCALRGSTVDITCTYKYPYKMSSSTLVETLWFTKGDHKQPVDLLSDTDYAGRVEYRCGENSCSWFICKGKCTLRIRDLRQTDSTEYKFRFTTNRPGGKYTGDPGVTLSVTDLQVKVSFPKPIYPTWVQLECHSICLAGPHTWYKNGQYVSRGLSRYYRGFFKPDDSFSCAVEGRERFHSPLVCKYTDARWTGPFSVREDRCNRVSYPTRNMCVLRGTSVDISCTYYSYQVFISDKYWFKWRDNQQSRDLQTEYGGRVEYPAEETGRSTLRITDLRDTDSAEYRFTFKSTSHEWKGTFHGTTLTVTGTTDLHFLPNSGLSVEVTPVATVTEGQRVTLTCMTSCPLTDKPSYMWYQNNGPVTGPKSPENQLVLDPVSPQHAGNYACSVRNYPHLRSPEETLTVQCTMNPPKTPSVTVSPSGEVVEGTSVTLSCSSDANPAANYTWFKVNTDHSSRDLNQGQQLIFGPIMSSDSGHYLCEAKNELGTKSLSIYINVKYPPKTPSVTVSPSGEVVEGSSVTLSCSSDANPAANYTWFKEHEDSVGESGQNYTITHITAQLGGNYYCQAHNAFGCHNSTFLFINVTVFKNRPLFFRDIITDRDTSCCTSRLTNHHTPPDHPLDEPLSVPVYDNVLFLTHRTAPAAQREPIEDQDDLHYGSIHISHSKNQEVPRGSAGCRVQSDQTDEGNDDWTVTYTSSNVCALRGSTVDITCTYKYPYKMSSSTLIETLWFTKGDKQPVDLVSDKDYAGRVEYRCGGNSCTWSTCKVKCTLRIRDLRQTDSAEYKFRFTTNRPGGKYTGDPGVTLSVTDLQVKVSFPDRIYPTWVNLECHSICDLAGPHTWYKNGQYVRKGLARSYRGFFKSEDSFSCAVEGRKPFHSPLVSEETAATVSYPTRNMCVLRGTSVDISCTYSSYEALSHKYWFKWRDNQQPRDLLTEYGGRVEYPAEETGRSTLRITDFRDTDSDSEYRFIFKSKSHEWKGTFHGTTLTVTGTTDRVTLTCITSCPLTDKPSYMWYQNNGPVTGPESPENQLVLDPVSPQHAGNYACSVRNYPHLRSPEETLTVQYAPKTPSVTVSPSGEILEGSSVTLSCSSDANPTANYTWFKVNTDHSSRDLNQAQQLFFGPIMSSDSGQYLCEAKNELGTKSLSISINVKYGPKNTSVISSPSGEVVEGSSVTLSCSSDANPAANYTWFKVNTDHSSRDLNQGQQLVFGPIMSSDSGKYLCEAKNELGTKSLSIYINVKYGPKNTSVILSPSGEVVEGSSVTLSCSSDANPAANYTWFKEHEDSVGESGQNYTITNFTAQLGGNYYCQAHNAFGRHNSTFLVINVPVFKNRPLFSRDIITGCDTSCCTSRLTNHHTPPDHPLDEVRYIRSLSPSSLTLISPPLSVPVYENVLFLTNRTAPAAQREPIEDQDDLHYGSIHISHSKNQEVPHGFAGCRVQSDQTDQFLYSALQGNDDWTVTYTSSNVCALRGSTVDITCTYQYPYKMFSSTLKETLWFTKGDHKQPVDLLSDTDYAGRVEYRCGEHICSWSICKGKCTLRIRDLRQTDSAEYKFMFTTNRPGGKYTGDPGVTLSVTDLQVKVIPSTTSSRLTLECHSAYGAADNQTFIWYKNGQSVRGVSTRSYSGFFKSEDSFSCAVEGHERFHSPLVCKSTPQYTDMMPDGMGISGKITTCILNAPKTPSVTVSPSGEVVEGSSVTLSCSSDANPAANYTWFKVNTDHSYRDLNQGQQLVFGPIMSSDSGQYLCEAKNELGTKSLSISINVKYGPKRTSVILSPSGEVVEGSSVTLSCSSDANPAANYTWFKEHEDSVGESGQNHTITHITAQLGGNYYCQAHNAFGRHNSTFLFINVTVFASVYPPGKLTPIAAVGVVVSLVIILLLIFLFLWLRRLRSSRKASGLAAETVGRQEEKELMDRKDKISHIMVQVMFLLYGHQIMVQVMFLLSPMVTR